MIKPLPTPLGTWPRGIPPLPGGDCPGPLPGGKNLLKNSYIGSFSSRLGTCGNPGGLPELTFSFCVVLMLTTAGLVFSTKVVKSGKFELAAYSELLTKVLKEGAPKFKDKKIPKINN